MKSEIGDLVVAQRLGGRWSSGVGIIIEKPRYYNATAREEYEVAKIYVFGSAMCEECDEMTMRIPTAEEYAEGLDKAQVLVEKLAAYPAPKFGQVADTLAAIQILIKKEQAQ